MKNHALFAHRQTEAQAWQQRRRYALATPWAYYMTAVHSNNHNNNNNDDDDNDDDNNDNDNTNNDSNHSNTNDSSNNNIIWYDVI